MIISHKVRCPNCGNHADRTYITRSENQIIQTQCPSCDYLMVNCSQGKVMEAYAPGIRAYK